MSRTEKPVSLPARRRRSRHGGYLRDALYVAARRVVDKEGHRALTLRRLVKEVRRKGFLISDTAPLAHFKRMSLVHAHVAADGWQELAEVLWNAQRSGGPPREQLRRLVDTYVAFAVKHEGLFRVMYDSPLWKEVVKSGVGEFQRMRMGRDNALACYAKVVELGIDAGQFRAGDPLDLARLPASLSHGLAMEFIDERIPGRETEVRRLTTLAIEGLARPVKTTSN